MRTLKAGSIVEKIPGMIDFRSSLTTGIGSYIPTKQKSTKIKTSKKKKTKTLKERIANWVLPGLRDDLVHHGYQRGAYGWAAEKNHLGGIKDIRERNLYLKALQWKFGEKWGQGLFKQVLLVWQAHKNDWHKTFCSVDQDRQIEMSWILRITSGQKNYAQAGFWAGLPKETVAYFDFMTSFLFFYEHFLKPIDTQNPLAFTFHISKLKWTKEEYRHLRNAVAHGNFHFKNFDLAHFQDIDPKKNRVVWEKTLTLNEFFRAYTMLADFLVVLMLYTAIHTVLFEEFRGHPISQ